MVIFCARTAVSGQEIILSQPFSASQYQNPSSAGGGAYDQRFQSNYKNQLIDGNTDLFRSFLFSYDTRLKYDLEESYNYLIDNLYEYGIDKKDILKIKNEVITIFIKNKISKNLVP